MARIRTIKPEFWKHEELSALPEATHLLAAALLNYADDYGYFNANPALIQAECFPLREPSVSVPESLRSLQEIGYIQVAAGPKGKQYGRITKFGDHQRVSHPTESKIKDLSIDWENSGAAPEILRKPPETFRPEGKGKEQGKEEDTASAVSTANGKYAFESGVVRLTEKDLRTWEQGFAHLDVRAELLGLSEWAGQQGQKWFHAVSGALAKKNREAKHRLDCARAGPDRPLTPSGNPWPEGII